ncbi:hypothetical protein AU252_12485 [Pseudarthrobacter sulfonivorans]|uniref:Htaa domain-containing protein n=1 Tax=Pseudarthrobacter sulfonivorans TaxID=121292 RepID=A0A0U3PC10_9MICC|nr:HtaA domain-containing protein [Pseudarthrobacter sulfonivorans]ALV41875.1 hypothetical protein AU252_12485 [Pseudarthrobacter sulfonivorans]
MSNPNSIGSLTWAVRDSLMRYVTVIAGGSYEIDGPATIDDSGVFTFPLVRAVASDGGWRLLFAGSLHFTAHHGLLDIRIIDPEIVVGPTSGALLARTEVDSTELTAIVELGTATPAQDGDVLVWDAVPSKLLGSAVEMFGTVYPAGTDMAPLGIRITIDS